MVCVASQAGDADSDGNLVSMFPGIREYLTWYIIVYVTVAVHQFFWISIGTVRCLGYFGSFGNLVARDIRVSVWDGWCADIVLPECQYKSHLLCKLIFTVNLYKTLWISMRHNFDISIHTFQVAECKNMNCPLKLSRTDLSPHHMSCIYVSAFEFKLDKRALNA